MISVLFPMFNEGILHNCLKKIVLVYLGNKKASGEIAILTLTNSCGILTFKILKIYVKETQAHLF